MILIDKKERTLGDTAYRESDGNSFVLSDYTLSYSGKFQQFEIIEKAFELDKRTVLQAILSTKIVFADNMVSGDDASIYLGLYEHGNDLGIENDIAWIGVGASLAENFIINPFMANRIFDLLPLVYDIRVLSTMTSQTVTPLDWYMQDTRLSLFTIN